MIKVTILRFRRKIETELSEYLPEDQRWETRYVVVRDFDSTIGVWFEGVEGYDGEAFYVNTWANRHGVELTQAEVNIDPTELVWNEA